MRQILPEEEDILRLALTEIPTNEPQYIGGKHRRRERRKAERKFNKKKK